jgi:uncharacterized protein (DUF1800 family)
LQRWEIGVTDRFLAAQVAQAFNRFGLGGRPDDTLPTNPITWLTDQLTGTDPLANGPPTLANCLAWQNAVMTAPPNSAQQKAAEAALKGHFLVEQQNALTAAVTTKTPFRERLVLFWANHFAVLSTPGTTEATAGNFVRNAIRPYVTGTFSDMLLAVMQHPAMLVSLNNDQSIGPQSPYALNSGLGGINENLARETLELYTVGLAANYTQADVDALAYMLTGWTVSYSGSSVGFTLDANLHQPGPQTLLGVTYPGEVFDAYQALLYLGTHPLTYAHLATKLVTHFVSDTPDPADIATVTKALTDSQGSLAAAATAIIYLRNAWVPQTKIRTPMDFILAACRAVAADTPRSRQAAIDVGNLGEPLWQPPFPNGWSDLAAIWASPAQMVLRADWASNFCIGLKVDPAATAVTALGELISPATRSLMGRLPLTHDKLTVLFCCPEFQRR